MNNEKQMTYRQLIKILNRIEFHGCVDQLDEPVLIYDDGQLIDIFEHNLFDENYSEDCGLKCFQQVLFALERMNSRLEESENCTCKEKHVIPHSCPYSKKYNNDHKTMCQCCENCTEECSRSL